MDKFVNRNSELATLEAEYQSKESAFVIIYGRRRVGKTTLISQFSQDKKSVYFLATEESESLNRRAFQGITAEMLDNQLLKNATIERWEDIFQEIIPACDSERIVIVIDEFQYLGKANPSFPSVMQKIWDSQLKGKNIMIILCGSLVSMMESQTLSYNSPLYGRRTSQIKLQQIPFEHYHEFFNPMEKRELIKYYSVTGGVPKYIESLNHEPCLYAAIGNRIINKNSFLYDEPTFLLQKEVTEIGSYFSIISSIALGNHRLSDISNSLQVKQTNLTKYLGILIDLDLVRREVPITEANPEKSKKGLYFLNDNFLSFWFRFVQPYTSYIESGHPEYAMQKIEHNFIDNHVSFVYEEVCRTRMWTLIAEGNWPFSVDKIGRWWNQNNEIDIVAFDSQSQNIIFGECKFWKEAIGLNVLRDLEEKSNAVIWQNRSRSNFYVLFSISGFTDELTELAAKREDLLLFE